jgi:hypothetical protein
MPRESQNDPLTDDEDPVLQMWGVGKEIWAPEGGDAFIARERRECNMGPDCIPPGDFQSPAVEPVRKPTKT